MNKLHLYIATRDLWILGTFYRKNQQLELLPHQAKSFIMLGYLTEVTHHNQHKTLPEHDISF